MRKNNFFPFSGLAFCYTVKKDISSNISGFHDRIRLKFKSCGHFHQSISTVQSFQSERFFEAQNSFVHQCGHPGHIRFENFFVRTAEWKGEATFVSHLLAKTVQGPLIIFLSLRCLTSWCYIFSFQRQLNSQEFFASPDLEYVIIPFNKMSVFRHSFTAQYALYSVKSRYVMKSSHIFLAWLTQSSKSLNSKMNCTYTIFFGELGLGSISALLWVPGSYGINLLSAICFCHYFAPYGHIYHNIWHILHYNPCIETLTISGF